MNAVCLTKLEAGLAPVPAGPDELLTAAKLARSSAKLLLGEQATEAAINASPKRRLPFDSLRDRQGH